MLLLYIQWVKQQNVRVVNVYQLISSTVKQWTFLLCGQAVKQWKRWSKFLVPVLSYGIDNRDITSITYRAAAFDVTGCKTSATPSDILCFAQKTVRQESSKFYSDLRNASSLEFTKYYCTNCRCSAVAMPIKLSSYATWSTSEMVASVQLPLTAVFFCLAEVVSHVILWRQCSRSMAVGIQCIWEWQPSYALHETTHF